MEAIAITQTKAWITKIVIGKNLCPFASKPFVENKITYIVDDNFAGFSFKKIVQEACKQLANNSQIETTLIIFTKAYGNFNEYLKLYQQANELLNKWNYSGIFQLASFHPNYVFNDTLPDDITNYTNRSPYPMLHIIREASIVKARSFYPNIHEIPINNKNTMQQLGINNLLQLMQQIKESK
jgi:uncharacterized protein